MARNKLDIVVTVIDSASKPLQQIEGGVKRTSKAAKDASIDITGFNRSLFATTALAGTFARLFKGAFTAIEEGAGLDRVTNQYENTFGPRGKLFSTIENFTDVHVDKVEAMKSATALGMLGIRTSVEGNADLIAKAAVAGKMANIGESEGIRIVTEAMKDSNLASLDHLNILAKNNPAMKAQMAVLGKATGLMSGAVLAQYKLKVITDMLTKSTAGQMKGFRDLLDSVLDFKQSISFLKNEIGTFLGTALAPLGDKLAHIFNTLTETIRNAKADKNLLFLARTFAVLAGAITTTLAVIGTFRLGLFALTSLGFGIPGVVTAVLMLTAGFLGLTHGADGIIERFKVLGAFFKGTWQLIHSFLSDPENFAAGIGKLDESVAQLLEKNGLLEFAKFTAQGFSILYKSIAGVVDIVKNLMGVIGSLTGGILNPIIQLVGWINKITGSKGRWTLGEGLSPGIKAIKDLLVTLTALGAGYGIYKGISALGSKLPFIGGIFGGKTPKGTKSEPIYVRNADGITGAAAGLLSGGLWEVIKKILGIDKLISVGRFGTISGIGSVLGRIGMIGGGIAAGVEGVSSIATLTNKNASQKEKFSAGYGLAGEVFGGVAGALLGGPVGAVIGANLGNVAGKAIVEFFDSEFGGSTSKKAIIPDQPQNTQDAIDMVMMSVQSLNESEANKRITELKAALNPDSQQEKEISPSEWAAIWGSSLDNSEVLNKIAKNVESNNDSLVYGRRVDW